MYDALIGLYTINNIGQKINLKNELFDVIMTKDDIVVSYFTRISQLREQFQAMDEVISDTEVVTTIFNGLSNSWY